MFRRNAGVPEYLLILDAHGNWGFPKGHLTKRESGSQAARREIGEETGLTELRLLAPLGTIDWHFATEDVIVHKFCHFYLFECLAGEPVPEEVEGIVACAWYPLERAIEIITYDNAKEILIKANREVSRGVMGRSSETMR